MIIHHAGRPSGRTAAALASGLVLAASLTACNPNPDPPANTGNGPTGVSATYKYHIAGGSQCSVQSTTWSATPGTLGSGSGGTASQSQSSGPTTWPASGTDCVLNHSFTNLRPGTWQVTIAIDGTIMASCSASLPGSALHNLQMNGCTVL